MGAPTDMLVVVATLYDNPQGLTKEEVLDRFDRIKLNGFLGLKEYLKSGLYGFSRLFNLSYTEQYLENRKKCWNEEYEYFTKVDLIFGGNYSVRETSHKSIGKTRLRYKYIDISEFGENFFTGYKIGDKVWQGYPAEIEVPEEYKKEGYSFIVRDIFDQKITREDVSTVISKGDLEVEVVKFDSNISEFKFPEELSDAYPEYHAERIYNFNEKNGFLYPHKLYGIHSEFPPFRWIRKGEKYFLDFEEFSRIINPNSYFGESGWEHINQKNKSRYSLTDVVLTSEAIRRRNWRKLSYNAFFGDNRNFIYGNEKTFRRYEKAVLETELAVEAQKKGLTNFEFLREHGIRVLDGSKTPYEEIKRMLKEENKKIGIKKRKFTIERKKKQKEIKEQEIPF